MGSKAKPKTLEELVEHASKPQPRRPKIEGPRTARRGGSGNGPKETPVTRMKRDNPELLSQIQRERAAKRKTDGMTRGVPPGFTKYEWALQLEDARLLANRILRQMEKNGDLPENTIASRAMKSAIEMLASDVSTKDKIAVIRTLLEYNMAKPAATQNLNVKTAEDFLDELAGDAGPG